MIRTIGFLGALIAASGGLTATAAAQGIGPKVSITLAANGPEEVAAREQLARILANWDLSGWLFTREVRIEARSIPHSHPMLTVNSRYLANDTAQIATFIHEQLHWFLVDHRAATDSAIARLEQIFPGAPGGPPEGARGRYSTYLHLLVCLLEYDAIRSLFGEDAARRTMQGWRHYLWVYKQVLERPDPTRRTLEEFGLGVPDARKAKQRPRL